MSDEVTHSPHPPEEYCPECGANNSAYWHEDRPPPFCLSCRFPLQLIAGKYRLVRTISEGGMGIIFEGHHTKLSRDPKRAIKIIKPEIMKKAEIASRFAREVQVTGSLSQQNSHIVRVYDDFGEVPGFGYFYVMEYLEGEPVSGLLERCEGYVPLELCAHLFVQLCDAIQDAHHEGIIHRDLKPDNLLIVPRRKDPHFLKVIDFGIAKPIGHDADAARLTAGALGTPSYMSPEQCTNVSIDGRADIYAMGCILFELLTGVAPFSARTLGGDRDPGPIEVLTAHLSAPPPELLAFAHPQHGLTPAMAEVVRTAMAKGPDQRYPSVEAMERAFLQAVEEAQRGEAQATTSPATGATASPEAGRGTSAYGEPHRSSAPLASEPPEATPSSKPLATVSFDPQASIPQASIPQASSPQASSPQASRPETSTPSALDAPTASTLPGGGLESASSPEEPIPGSSAGLWVAGLLLLFLGIGGGVWLNRGKRPASKAPTKLRMLGVSGQKRATPADAAPSRSKAPEPRRRLIHSPRPAARPPLAKTSQPRRPRRRLRRKRRTPRLLRRPSTPRRPSTRRRRRPPPQAQVVPEKRPAPQGRIVARCPKQPRYHWVRLKLPQDVKKSLSIGLSPRGNGRIVHRSWGLCVGATRSTRIVLKASLYYPCTFSIWGLPRHEYPLLMQQQGYFAPKPNYCLFPAE